VRGVEGEVVWVAVVCLYVVVAAAAANLLFGWNIVLPVMSAFDEATARARLLLKTSREFAASWRSNLSRRD
jgi:hypothetical protein